MELNKGHIAFSIACAIVGIIIGASFRSCSGNGKPDTNPKVIHDTITITDTFRIASHTKPREVVKWDTCYLYMVEDTLHDTAKVQVPITQYEYRDTFATDTSRIELGITYEGYNAKIDSIDLQYRFEVQPKIIEKRRGFGWSVHIGPYVGYGATVIGNHVYAAPSAGVSISVGWGYNWRK